MVEHIPPRPTTSTNRTSNVSGQAVNGVISEGKTVLIDNYDSFTYNVVEYLSELGADLHVYRNDKITIEEIEALQPARLVISPGPGHPTNDSGISMQAIKHFAGKIPILGVCMGLQCIYAAYTGIVEFAGEIVHGKTSQIIHDGKGLFAGLPADGVVGTRYHSLAARIDSLPRELVVTSKTDSGIVMGIRHTRYTIEAIQYHPESILSKGGKETFANFLRWKGGSWAENPQSLIDEKAVQQAESTKEPVIAMAAAGSAAAAVDSASKTNTQSTGAGAVGTILERIHVQRLKDIAETKAIPGYSPEDLDTALEMNLAPPLINFAARLTSNAHLGLPGVMAEMKRASPSKGNIDAGAHAGAQALAYARGGANVISVLTEPKWFKGTINDLSLARKAVDGMPNRPAILRKDFIVDVYQIKEARLAGADTVLLIVAMLNDTQLKELYDYSVSLGMEPLVEVNNAEEMKRALKLGAKVVGVNNRNLHDFNVDMGTTSRLAEAAKEGGVILAALSGITGRADVEKYLKEGVGAVLVGEALMHAPDKKAFIHNLLGLNLQEGQAVQAKVQPAPLVKICGLSTVDAALSAAVAGADLIGMILAPGTKRTVSLTQAAEIVNVVRSVRGGSDSIRQAAVNAQESKAKSTSAQGSGYIDGQEWFAYNSDLIRANAHKPLIVGVFRNQSLEEIVHAAKTLKLDAIQMHGRTEHIEWSKFLPGVLVIRVFHIGADSIEEKGAGQGDLADAIRESCHHIIALDTAGATKGAEGGSGETFDWTVAKRIATTDPIKKRVRGVPSRQLPIMLAGGLNAENVSQAVENVQPFIVDTSSGVETDGVKDVAKIQAFIRAAKTNSTGVEGGVKAVATTD
ncbi:putative to anthranilate synthase component II [Meira miltonrushii]|uniref:Multifunctional tryptophan biosynthesis protein n=1 Tax=Meira miltonrushii TaxID=1280837 RepID=A0A316VGX0_9BASI|nr:putative to anthranilate synthase component II [Meira miltonrushii]PWN35251.1 putative to anthranilate synthase component II [Meira miltonrushii]